MDRLGNEYTLLVASGQKQGSVLGCKNIINLGDLRLNQLVAIYNRCDIFLTPSRLEGFGLSVAEAMACEKPVVATNCSSLPELVVDGKGGFLCQMDNVEDFVQKIRYFAADENLRREMGLFNRRRVEEKFTIEKMTKGYIQIYQSLLK
jgi:glycosyltransferase involved in cell wall biosynthesis